MRKNLFEISVLLLFLLNPVFGKGQGLLELKNAKLYYQVAGAGKPILLVSGGPGNSSDDMRPVADSLSKKFMVILFDQRGTGKSITDPFDSSTINLKTAIDDIEQLRKALKINKWTIAGESWGAMLGMAYSTLYPNRVEQLVLIAPGPLKIVGNDPIVDNMEIRKTTEDKDSLAYYIRNFGKDSARAYFMFKKISFNWLIFDRTKSDSIFKIANKANVNYKMQSLMVNDLKKNYDMTSTLRKYAGKVTIICGRQDPGWPQVVEIKEILPRTQLIWIEQCGHYIYLEQPEIFLKKLISIL